MALRNVVGAGSYGVIDQVRVDKKHSSARWQLTIYADSSRTKAITALHFSVFPAPQVLEIAGLVATALDVPSDGKRYIVLYPADETHADRNCYMAKSAEGHLIESESPLGDRAVAILPDGRRYVFSANPGWGSTWEPGTLYEAFTVADFAKFFAADAQSEQGNNAYAAAYAITKTHPALAHAEDA